MRLLGKEVEKMSLRKTLGFFVLLAVFHLWLTSPWLQAGTAIDTLYEKAKKEGELTIWGPENNVGAVVSGFNKRFPALRATHFEMFGTEAVQRIVLEAQAGQTNVDVLAVSIKDAMVLIKRDLLTKYATYDWVKSFENAGVTKNNILLDGYALSFFHLETPLIMNTNLVSKEAIPRSWEDVLNPRWRDKILLEQRAREWGYLAIRWSDERLREFAKKLKEQKPRFARGGITLLQMMAAGEGALGTGGYGYYILMLQKKGAPVDIAPVSPVGVGTRGFSVLKNAKHPVAAQLFAVWVSSPEGQQVLEAGTGQGSLAPGSKLKLASVYRDKGIELLFEAPDNIDRVERGIEIIQEALGIK
jgi:iron(III) transport system substrate-binding protein